MRAASLDEALWLAEARLDEQRVLLPPTQRAAAAMLRAFVTVLDFTLKIVAVTIVPLAVCLLTAPVLSTLNGGPAWLLLLLALGMTTGTLTSLAVARVMRHLRLFIAELALRGIARTLRLATAHVGGASPLGVPVTGVDRAPTTARADFVDGLFSDDRAGGE